MDIKKLFNTVANPFESKDVYRIPGQTPTEQTVTRGATLALTLGAAAALLRASTRPNDAGKRQEELRAWAGSRFPVMSIDTSLRDSKKEDKLRGAGVPDAPDAVSELNKQADGEAAKSFVKKPLGYLHDIATGDFGVDEPAVALAAALGGIYGGYKLSDYIHDARRKDELDANVKSKRNEIDKLIYKEYMRTRGMDKKAGDIFNMSDDPSAKSTPIRSGSRVLGAGGTAWVMLSMALAYKYSKDWHDKNDPARARVKQLKEVARSRARQTQAPIMLDTGSMPDSDNGTRTVKKAPAKMSAPITTSPGLSRTATDPSDPLGSLLG